MRKNRALPDALRSQAASRTDASVTAIHDAMEALGRELEAKAYDLAQPLTIKDVMARAGVNPKLLYGPRHREVTKPQVEAFVKQVNAARAQRRQAEEVQTPLMKAKEDMAYWKERYEKLAQHAHLWKHRMFQQQRRIRELEGEVGRVVALPLAVRDR